MFSPPENEFGMRANPKGLGQNNLLAGAVGDAALKYGDEQLVNVTQNVANWVNYSQVQY